MIHDRTNTTCYLLGGLVEPRPIPGIENTEVVVAVAGHNVDVGLVVDTVAHGLLEFTDFVFDLTRDKHPTVRTLPTSVRQS